MNSVDHPHFDIHLSAESISPETIVAFEALGFKKDFFQNNRNSKPPHYHASYETHLDGPDDALWDRAISLLKSSPGFRGCLEEEEFGGLRYDLDTPLRFRRFMRDRPFELETCRPGEHKACDLHINIDVDRTLLIALNQMDGFNFCSFDRTVDNETHRIYSLTFEDVVVGEEVLHRLHRIFQKIPGLVGKMKLEKVTRFMVYPPDAEQLPIVRSTFAKTWLTQ
jgi:hypothetical protein